MTTLETIIQLLKLVGGIIIVWELDKIRRKWQHHMMHKPMELRLSEEDFKLLKEILKDMEKKKEWNF